MAWKDTLNLPDTAFPMKANLVQREPEILARWASARLYERIREARHGKPLYVMHDGPPYANGEGHVGHFRNKILKDVVVRYRTMKGFDAPMTPGWDCHGLPIEHNVMKDLGAKAATTSAPEVRRLCREYAEKFVAIQRDNFMRFGAIGDWYRPYLTMSPEYEAGVLDVFADLAEKGYVARGLRSIHWCVTCKTALAEAELEYGPETSPSIHVRFAVAPESLAVVHGTPTSVVIWTTTPWTLPANVAVAVHPKLQYAVVEHDGPDRAQRVVVALPLVEKYLAAVGATEHKIPMVLSGTDLRGVKLRHPFIDRVVPVVTADYVSAEDGTGCVHTAPGHGADDFATGKREGLPILCPVGPDGIYTAEVGVPSLVGTHVFKADAPILALLAEKGALAASSKLEHSYPHCWRCRKPVIFRATDQWFVLVDHEGLREKALAACDGITWVPAWGKQRMTGMLKTRPDWCISRQRTWGVPIPALYCEDCGDVTTGAAHVKLIRHVREVIAKEGADAWFVKSVEDLTPKGLACKCGGKRWRRETDIFDVWFESGSSWKSVCTKDHGLSFPADMYLESQDQHRGWFQSSLLPAIASEGVAPFRTCVTNGFFTDDAGDKVSKSKGGMKELSTEVLTKQLGADIARLFFISGNYFEDIAISRRQFDPAADQYRKIRNTLRFILGGLGGFKSEDAVDLHQAHAIDRWAIQRMDEVLGEVDAAYETHEYQRASALLREFMDGELSAFYLDLVKDRLYCAAKESAACRSAQTTLLRLAVVLIKCWAPLLPFTCEEAWDALPGIAKQASVHLELWPHAGSHDPARAAWVATVRRVRTEIQKKIDPLRKAGTAGSAQDVAVRWASDEPATRAALLDDSVRFLGEHDPEGLLEILGVAEFRAADTGGSEATDIAGLTLAATRSELERCDRCWRRRAHVKSPAAGAAPLCARCEAWRGKEGV
jgi:isoleucyl-tRNA synthetase